MSDESITAANNSSILKKLTSISLVKQIIIAIILGTLLAVLSPNTAKSLSMLGGLFVSALKAVAPILVLVLVASSIANQSTNSDAKLKPIVLTTHQPPDY